MTKIYTNIALLIVQEIASFQFFLLEIGAMFDILREILQSYPFLMSQNFKTQGCQWYEVLRLKPIFADKENSELGLGCLCIISSIFKKTDLKQHLLIKACCCCFMIRLVVANVIVV